MAVSVCRNISQSNELGLSGVKYNEHDKVAGIFVRSLSAHETDKTPACGNRQESKSQQAMSGAVEQAVQQSRSV